ncbi:MAG: anhydro-N-acetylmuramic acid kinase [Rhodothermia bacterium]|nr:MAG: anhydro-N-acetylmuramic acid kinase [Rhodothermia bacterium]
MSDPLQNLFSSDERLVVGVMSGTSVDGIDVATVRVSGSGSAIQFDILGMHTSPFEPDLSEEILKNSVPETSSVRSLTLLNARLAHAFARAIRDGLEAIGQSMDDVDAVGLHGQTVYHQPEVVSIAGLAVSGTMQVGDPSVLANLLGCTVVGDFRLADMALGGQGAPLVPYFDYVCFRHEKEGRLLLNLGGIANITVLPANCAMSDVTAFDTGPANMVLDGLSKRLYGEDFDKNGSYAAAGNIDDEWLSELMAHPYFRSKPPKSTGRELFSAAYVDQFIHTAETRGFSKFDMLATASALTIRTIFDAYERFIAPNKSIDRLIASGGGVYNDVLLSGLKNIFEGVIVETTAEHGLDPGAKEAACFAVLAHETLNGVATNLPSVTGAHHSTILGKICIPA